MTQEIKLNFINHSNDNNNSSIVIFQKNVAEEFCETAIAWRVIKNCGRDDNHPFIFPLQFEVGGSDSYGNFTPQYTAHYGQAYEMVKDSSGDILQLSNSQAISAQEVVITNNLKQGAINAHIYRDGKLLSTKPKLAPEQLAIFQFHPQIFIGVVSQIEEGDVMNSATIQQIHTEINLLGIRSADIIMTGGAAGRATTPFHFELANIKRS